MLNEQSETYRLQRDNLDTDREKLQIEIDLHSHFVRESLSFIIKHVELEP